MTRSQMTPDETLLGLIKAQSAHGYVLLGHFREGGLGRVWSLSTSQLYAVLKRLENAGWIVGHEVHMPDAPARTEYAITPAGERQLLAWLNHPQPSPSVRRVRVEFLSRLYIARLLNLPTIPIVLSQRRTCRQKLAELLEERERAAMGVDYLAVDFVIEQTRAILHWIERTELLPKDTLDD